MKTFLQFISSREFSYRWHNFYKGIHQLGLHNVVSKNRQFCHCSSSCWQIKRPYVLSTCPLLSEKLLSKSFSVKVDTEHEGIPFPEPVEKTKDEPIKKEMKYDYLARGNSVNAEHATHLIQELKFMAKEAWRDDKKVNEICHKLNSMELEISTKMYVSLLYYLSVLSKPHEGLLNKILKNLTERLHEIYKPTPLITSIAKSMGSLLIRDTSALDAIIGWYISGLGKIDLSTAGEVINSMAILNYYPSKADVLLNELIKSDPLEYSSNIKFLNFVWSLVLLDRAELDLIRRAMSLEYKRKLEAILAPEARVPVYLKLNNICGYVRARNLPIKVDSGLYTSDTPWLFKLKIKRQKDTFSKNLIDALVNLLPPRTFRTFIEYESGCILDVLCYFNEEHQPEQEIQYMKNKKGTKLVIQCLGFKDLCLPDKKIPTGIIMFHKNHLEASGFRVLFIPFNEYPISGSLKTKSEYMVNKIRTVLPKFSVNER